MENKEDSKASVWEPTCKRFLAFMDIMGFKDRVFRNDHELIIKTMKLFRSSIFPLDEAAKIRENQKTKMTRGLARPLFFSDSILLISADDSEESGASLLYNAQWLLGQALLQGIPMKGAIAYGEQTADFDESLHVGRPLIDAYELQNELFLYGIVLHHTAEEHLNVKKMLTNFEKNGLICNYPTPMKSSIINHWLTKWDNDFLNEDTFGAVKSKLYNSVSGPPRRYVDNTVNFVDWLKRI